MFKSKLILPLLIVFFISACSLVISSQDPSDGKSGIEVYVTIGPTCPGPVQLGDTTCQNKPYQAKITVLNENNKRITQFTTDGNGYFKISLKPGNYIIHPESGDPLPQAGDQPVTVIEGQFTEVNILFDTGMR